MCVQSIYVCMHMYACNMYVCMYNTALLIKINMSVRGKAITAVIYKCMCIYM